MSAKPSTMVASPPVTTTPSSQWRRASMYASTAARESTGKVSACQASCQLWQVGQRMLQPPRKTTQLL